MNTSPNSSIRNVVNISFDSGDGVLINAERLTGCTYSRNTFTVSLTYSLPVMINFSLFVKMFLSFKEDGGRCPCNLQHLCFHTNICICRKVCHSREPQHWPHQMQHRIQVSHFAMIATKYVCARSVLVSEPVTVLCHHRWRTARIKDLGEISNNRQE